MVEQKVENVGAIDVTELLGSFSDRIKIAFDNDRMEPKEDRRERCATALIVVADFVTRVVGHDYGDHFFEMASAITDLNDGTVADLLRPKVTGARPRDSSKLWRARAYVAVALQALIFGGQKPLDAARKLLHEFPEIAKLASRNSRSRDVKTTILEWRKGFNAGRVKNFEARALYDAGRKLIDFKQWDTPDLKNFARGRVRAALRLSGLSPLS